MDLQNSNGSSGADKQKPSLIDLGTFFVDADIIFGFTSHLLKRKAKVSISQLLRVQKTPQVDSFRALIRLNVG